MGEYYDGTKLLSMKDINGETPEIFMCTTNRTGGKTTYFGRLVCNRFFKRGEKFCLIYRFNYELDDVANKFYKDIQGLFFPGTVMTSIRKAKGVYHELFIDNISCGYAIALNSADQIKRLSHLFSDVSTMLFDEFQSESNHYCADEIKKLFSVHTSIARGQGEQVRYVPVIMLGNDASLLNPYYVAMGITSRLRNNTRFLKGDGFVLEHGYIESASRAQKSSGFNRAFASSEYFNYAAENVYLNDNTAFIDQPSGPSRYLATVKSKGKHYAIREYAESGILYVDHRADLTFNVKIVATTDDHAVNYVMLKRNDFFISNLRYYFEHGCFRFKDLESKDSILTLLSY